MSLFDSVKEVLLGKSTSKQEFEDSIQETFKVQAREQFNHTGKLEASHIEQMLWTWDGSMWVGPIFMGRFTQMDVVYDTGSDWLVVEDDRCDTCEGNTYSAETSGEPASITISERSYGSAYLTGMEYTDAVCLNLNDCVWNYEFFSIFF